MSSIIKIHPLLKIVNGALVDLPSPRTLSAWWGFGSLLGLCLGVQLLTGLFLAIHFVGDISLAFDRVREIGLEINQGWLLRTLHANGGSLFFACLFLHAGRGIYYGSYKLHITWRVGVVILLAVMGAAFMGYVLPWGQISFWGARVITGLLTAVPYLGIEIVNWVWGGFAVDNATLTRFFTFHFLIPFLVAALAIVHLLFLHQTGSNNPLGTRTNCDKLPFHPYFAHKDLLEYLLVLRILILLVLGAPWALGDPENFILANPLVAPAHIQPEWYFLFAYAILRSIPNKLGGVIALAGAILVLLVLPFTPKSKFHRIEFYPVTKVYFWFLVNSVFLLTWIGARPAEGPYIFTGQILSVFYFVYYLMARVTQKLWDRVL